MTLSETKEKMLTYMDFYGGGFIHEDRIKEAKSKKELAEIVEKHGDFMEDMLADVHRHLDNFKKEIGLKWLD